MVGIAHLARASGCGPEGGGFDPLYSPQKHKRGACTSFLFLLGVSKGDIQYPPSLAREAADQPLTTGESVE